MVTLYKPTLIIRLLVSISLVSINETELSQYDVESHVCEQA